jgi:hypothetical protein
MSKLIRVTKELIQPFHGRLVMAHIAGISLVIMAFRQLFLLVNTDIVKIYGSYGDAEGILRHLRQMKIMPTSAIGYVIWNSMAPSLALFTGAAISLLVVLKRNISWLNALLAGICCYLLYSTGVYQSAIFRKVFYAPGRLFANTGPAWVFFINGVLLLSIGLILLFIYRKRKQEQQISA